MSDAAPLCAVPSSTIAKCSLAQVATSVSTMSGSCNSLCIAPEGGHCRGRAHVNTSFSSFGMLGEHLASTVVLENAASRPHGPGTSDAILNLGRVGMSGGLWPRICAEALRNV
eukprot:CAMPEP_0170621884 /NCGR_PEP_ID=MMETSP0224-20130122/28836_1 /TAXON_ID=285029 /ORGANISM="Togula jolla, Strain CCCM 725" /LENGTH=112 /DNA_ID=CAMNT_0010948167 /DNA_START=95 /DNA_END=433 /DNA_ORIENTATION=+